MEETNRPRIASLIRVSADSQATEDKMGIERQRNDVETVIKKLNAIHVIACEIIGYSGTIVHETEKFIELLRYYDEVEKFNYIVLPEIDRTIRPGSFLLWALEELMIRDIKIIESHGRVYNLNDGFDRADILQIVGLAGRELATMKKRFHEGKDAKRRLGKHPNSWITLSTGITFNSITGEWGFNEDIDKPKNVLHEFDKGNTNYRALGLKYGVSQRTIRNWLQNKIYMGIMEYKEKRGLIKYRRVTAKHHDLKKIKRTPDEIISNRVYSVEEAAISKDMFERIQEKIREKRNAYQQRRTNKESNFIYRGFFLCRHCLVPMYTQSGQRLKATPKPDYYRCKYHTLKHSECKCNGKSIRRDKVESQIDSLIEKILSSKITRKKLIDNFKSIAKQRQNENELQILKRKIQRIDEKMERLGDLYFMGNFSKEYLYEKTASLTNEREATLKILNSSDYSNVHQIENLLREFEEMAFIVNNYKMLNREEKRAIVKSFGVKFTIDEDGLSELQYINYKESTHMDTDS